MKERVIIHRKKLEKFEKQRQDQKRPEVIRKVRKDRKIGNSKNRQKQNVEKSGKCRGTSSWHSRREFTEVEAVLVSTFWDELCSLVERPLLICHDDLKLLGKAQVAPPCSILVCSGSPPNRPSDVKISVLVLQRPDVLRKGGAVPVASVSHRVLVAVEPFLDRQSGESGVIPPAVGCLNRRSVHHRLHLAVTIHRAVALCPAVALFRIGCVAFWRSWRLADVVDGGLIMLPDDRGHVRHAAVAHLQRVFIEDFVEPGVLREMLTDERAKLSANVGGNILAKRWVEPSDVAGPILPSHIRSVV